MKGTTLYLIKRKPFTKNFPGWPEIVSVYNRHLPRLGYDVWWISPSPEVRRPEVRKWGNVNLYLIPFDESSIRRRIASQIRFAWHAFRFLKKRMSGQKNGRSIIQSRDNLTGAILALLFKRRYGTRAVFNYSFLFYEEARDALKDGQVSVLKFVYRWMFYKALLYPLLHRFDVILPISREMKIKLARELGLPESRQTPLPLGVDPEVFHPPSGEEKRRLRKELGFNSTDVIFLYPGSITKPRQVRRFIGALIPVIGKYKNARLVLIGRGDDVEGVLQDIASSGAGARIHLIRGWIPLEEVLKYYMVSDVGISLMPPREYSTVSSPCKLFEYLGSKLVTISNPEIPEQRRVVSGSKGGILIEWSSIPSKLPEAAEYLITSPKARRKMAVTGYRHVLKNRPFRKHAERMDRVYKALFNTGG